LRIKSGYTQSQIAKILNIDRSTYSYYEIGKTMPDVSSLLTLAKIFNISISELLADESNPKMMKKLSDSGIRMDYISGKKNISHIYELSSTEQELVGIFRTCSENQQKEIIDYFNNIASKR
jgi:transcriptional regulator with XRE-family HTH domain